MKIDLNKKYTYRNGEPARILCVDETGDRTHIISKSGGGVHFHAPDGSAFDGIQYDLIEIPEAREPREWDLYGNADGAIELVGGDKFPLGEGIRVREILPEPTTNLTPVSSSLVETSAFPEVGVRVPYGEIPPLSDKKIDVIGLTHTFPDGRQISVHKAQDGTDQGLWVRILRPLSDDKTSELQFRISVEAACFLSGMMERVAKEKLEPVIPEIPTGFPPVTETPDAVNYKAVAEWLYALVDDIDTASDHAKGDDALYRRKVEELQRLRHHVGESLDGQTVTFKNPVEEYGLTRLFSVGGRESAETEKPTETGIPVTGAYPPPQSERPEMIEAPATLDRACCIDRTEFISYPAVPAPAVVKESDPEESRANGLEPAEPRYRELGPDEIIQEGDEVSHGAGWVPVEDSKGINVSEAAKRWWNPHFRARRLVTEPGEVKRWSPSMRMPGMLGLDSDGEYVRYSDHLAAIEALTGRAKG